MIVFYMKRNFPGFFKKMLQNMADVIAWLNISIIYWFQSKILGLKLINMFLIESSAELQF